MGITNGWIYIDEIEVDNTVNTIHCDTRDFHCTLRDDMIDLKDAKHPEITRVLHNPDYLIDESEIKDFIKNTETITGGKGSWRCMNFNGIKTSNGWFKYIRMYRIKSGSTKFVVCEGGNLPVKWRDMTSNNLIGGDVLNFMEND